MNLHSVPWFIPGRTKDDHDLSEAIRELGFRITYSVGPRLGVIPPRGWTAVVESQSESCTSAIVYDGDGNPQLECVEVIDCNDDGPCPPDIIYTEVLV